MDSPVGWIPDSTRGLSLTKGNHSTSPAAVGARPVPTGHRLGAAGRRRTSSDRAGVRSRSHGAQLAGALELAELDSSGLDWPLPASAAVADCDRLLLTVPCGVAVGDPSPVAEPLAADAPAAEVAVAEVPVAEVVVAGPLVTSEPSAVADSVGLLAPVVRVRAWPVAGCTATLDSDAVGSGLVDVQLGLALGVALVPDEELPGELADSDGPGCADDGCELGVVLGCVLGFGGRAERGGRTFVTSLTTGSGLSGTAEAPSR